VGTEDILIILSGLADFLNRISDQSTQVGAGQTGTANSNGKINTRQSTPDEQNQGSSDDNSQSNQVGTGGQGGGQQGGAPGRTKHELRIPGIDKDGNPKTVIIEWEE
ncbi:MAG: hypothetical protein HYY49_10695, partial [Ignavibacteriales bacterium]|nr:hypothetical protein [Ignavibacteriales bacterium]